MNYISTRGTAPVVGFEQALLAGLARDGGLYVPEAWPVLSPEAIRALQGAPYETVALEVLRPFVGAMDMDALKGMIDRAYASFGHRAVAPLVQVDAQNWVLELFHGPTLAFKDLAMQLIGLLFDHVLEARDERVTIVGATSGDTGSAAIEAFRGKARADVFILFPHGRVSEVQRRQMTTPTEANVHAIAVEGDFDDCQALVKAMFNDFEFRDSMKLGAVNSINWTRVMAQIVYYATSSLALGGTERRIDYSVPTGNFGDIFAGYVARKMGFPIGELIIATNENDILHRTVETGRYEIEGVTQTLTPSMDIQVSSNFERLLFDLADREGEAVAQMMDELKATRAMALPQGQQERLRAGFASARVDRATTLETIRETRRQIGMTLDPHTAVGLAAARQKARADTPMVTLATAHPAKFPDAVREATGLETPLPERMADLYERDERMTVLPNDLAAIENFIRKEAAA